MSTKNFVPTEGSRVMLGQPTGQLVSSSSFFQKRRSV